MAVRRTSRRNPHVTRAPPVGHELLESFHIWWTGAPSTTEHPENTHRTPEHTSSARVRRGTGRGCERCVMFSLWRRARAGRAALVVPHWAKNEGSQNLMPASATASASTCECLQVRGQVLSLVCRGALNHGERNPYHDVRRAGGSSTLSSTQRSRDRRRVVQWPQPVTGQHGSL
jgi:hypothetical protein